MVEVSLEMIQVMLQRVLDGQSLLREDMADVKRRLSSMEMSIAQIHADFAGQSMRIDRRESRLERIDRRLDLADA
jgi:hypothetical protein